MINVSFENDANFVQNLILVKNSKLSVIIRIYDKLFEIWVCLMVIPQGKPYTYFQRKLMIFMKYQV
jgi:hypothetical protein